VLYRLPTAVCSQSLAEAKKQNNTLTDRLQAVQTELSDSELRRTEVETQLRQTRNVSELAILCFRLAQNL